jgi:threonine dehydratase
LIKHIRAARKRLAPYLPPSPMLRSRLFDGLPANTQCLLKCENLQPTGSFKVRGALNKLLSISAEERKRGVVTASTGNHGRAVAFALGEIGGTGTVYIPESTPANKRAALHASGIGVVVYGADGGISEVRARAVANETGRVYVSPYNDAQVIAGQGTMGLEILDQCPEVDAIFIAVGGGGLVSGVASAVKAIKPDVQIIGCWPEHSRVMFECMRAGHVIDVPEQRTLSDATAGAIEDGAITVPLCHDLIDHSVFVTEDEITLAIRQLYAAHHMVVEGAAGVALAAYAKYANELVGRTSVIVLCGANIATDTLCNILREA